MSALKIWDSDKKTRSGSYMSMKDLREKTFLLMPSIFQEMEIRLAGASV